MTSPLAIIRPTMGLKGSGPFFQSSMANNVLAGYVTRICEIYIDDEYLDNTHKVLIRLRTKKVTASPEKTRLGLKQVKAHKAAELDKRVD